ncbi:MAG TPA: hypothetical protein VM734_33435 [Kofleriaceae bacterium]|jgi:HEAT repeat protein|nr:hypothetical protein [Kofleriaceae bacterium]
MRVYRLILAALLAAPVVASAQPASRPAPGRVAPPAKPKKVDVDKARAALLGADAAKAAQAATELGGSKDAAAHAALLDALATGLHPDVAAAALAALAAAPAKDDVATVRPYARHRNGRVRAAAVRALAAHDGTGADVLAALRDQDVDVRAAAAEAAARGKVKGATEPLLALFDKGELAAGLALGSVADADLARVIAEHLGTPPDGVMAQTLGVILKRPEFGPEPARVQVVRTLAKLAGPEAITVLGDYVDATPAKPPRQSRREAEVALKQKLGGE